MGPEESPSINNYTIGKGILYIAKWAGSAPGAYADVGNASNIDYQVTEQTLPHYSSRTGMREKDQETVVEVGYNLSFILDEQSVENMRMFIKASMSGTRVLYANQNVNQLYALKFISDNPVGPNKKVEFWKCKLTPNGRFSLISQEYTTLSFSGEGIADRVNHAVSPWFTETFDTTTSTTTTSTTTTTTD